MSPIFSPDFVWTSLPTILLTRCVRYQSWRSAGVIPAAEAAWLASGATNCARANGAEAASAVAQRIVLMLQQPLNLGGREHTVCASIGIALFPQDGAAIDALLRNADTAMYRAKDLGRGRAMFYDTAMGGQRRALSDTGLQLALRRREFSLFYQPQYSITDGSLTGLEALLRGLLPRSA